MLKNPGNYNGHFTTFNFVSAPQHLTGDQRCWLPISRLLRLTGLVVTLFWLDVAREETLVEQGICKISPQPCNFSIQVK